MAELLRDVDEVTRTASKVENVAARTAVERKILRAFYVAFDPKLGVAEAMHFLNVAWILLSQGIPRFVSLQLTVDFPRANGMQSPVHVLARARDNLGIEEFKQFVTNPH